MSNTTFLSTTIPYVNSKPHVGFALELVQADITSRFLRLRNRRVFVQTGSDENSTKNVLAARARGVTVSQHVDEHAAHFRQLVAALDISADRFVRTTSAEHRQTVDKFWRRLAPEDLYNHRYSGWYCVGCEDFISETELIDGHCPDHAAPPDWLDEENIFFRLSRYQAQIRELIASDRLKITPAFRKREILNFIDRGLSDISLTRDRKRSGDWGIPVPDHPEQVIYVWIDALINYLTGPGGAEPWNNSARRLHFLGKNVWKFHAIYWPGLLLSTGLALPDEIVIHGFLTIDGKKISKSSGPSIDPLELIRHFGSDSLRFYLARAVSPFEDGDFSLEKLIETHNTFLVNGIGNLVSRLRALAARVNLHAIELTTQASPNAEIERCLDAFRYDEALKYLWREFDRINAEISAEKPWEKLKTDPETGRRRIQKWLEDLDALTPWLAVFLPETARKIRAQLKDLQGNHIGHLFQRIDERPQLT